MVVLAVFTAITLIWAKEKPSTGDGPKTAAPPLREQLRVDVRGNKPFFWMIAHRLLFLVGIYALQSFIFYYVQDFLQAPDAAKTTGNLTATLGVLSGGHRIGWRVADRQVRFDGDDHRRRGAGYHRVYPAAYRP